MKYLLIGLSFLTLTFNAFALTPQKIYADSVKAILCLRDAESENLCDGTGFFVKYENEIFLVTNNHMLPPDLKIEPQKKAEEIDLPNMIAISGSGKEFRGLKLRHTNPKTDIAVIKVSNFQEGEDTYLEIAGSKENSSVGDDSYWIGNPDGLKEFTFSIGYIGKIENNGLSDELQIHGTGFHGSSGSPFINNDGKIIGILTSGPSKDEIIKIPSRYKGVKPLKIKQRSEYEEIQLGSRKESILKALEIAKAYRHSNSAKDNQIAADVATAEIHSENIGQAEPKNDLASLIRELKAYTPPEERKLGSL